MKNNQSVTQESHFCSLTMSAEEFEPLPFSFRSRDDAWEWVEKHHPGYSLLCFNNPDGTVGAYLEPPEEPEECCEHCGQSPCVMVENEDQFQGLLQLYQYDENLANRQRRFKMYQEMTRMIHGGYLGKGNRKELPLCVTEAIRNTFPNNDPAEAFVGFKEANIKDTV